MADMVFVIGLLLVLYAGMMCIGSMIERTRSDAVFWAAVCAVAGGMLVYGLMGQADGFSFGDIPDVFIRAIASIRV